MTPPPTYHLRLSASNLPKQGKVLKAVPSTYCVVSSVDHDTKYGQTEVVAHAKNPQWTTCIEIPPVSFYVHVFHQQQDDSNKTCLGSALFSSADLLEHHTKSKRLAPGGCLFARLEQQSHDQRHGLVCHMSVCNVILPHQKRRMSNESSLVLQISQRTPQHSWVVVHRSEQDHWKEWTLRGVEMDTQLQLALVHRHRETVGLCETTVDFLLHGNSPLEEVDASVVESVQRFLWLQRNETKLKQVGQLLVHRAEWVTDDDAPLRDDPILIPPPPSPTHEAKFQHYIVEKGCVLNLSMALDFTSSNGDPRQSTSLHYLADQDALNEYQETMTIVGEALEEYLEDDDGINLLGFGAKFDGVVRHLFHCGSAKDVAGLRDVYRATFDGGICLSGPTVFTQVLQWAAVHARKRHQQMNEVGSSNLTYDLLLIVTDGCMDDVEETKRKLGVYSTMPLSIVFVGLGRSDFTLLHQLAEPLAGCRSNVTVVEFRQHQHDSQTLATLVLEQVTSQLCAYMKENVL